MKHLQNFKNYEFLIVSTSEIDQMLNLPKQNFPTDREVRQLQKKSPVFNVVTQVTNCDNQDITIDEAENYTRVRVTVPAQDGNLFYICYPTQIILGQEKQELIDAKLEIVKTYNTMDDYNRDNQNIQSLQSICQQGGSDLKVYGKQNQGSVLGWVATIIRRSKGGVGKDVQYTDIQPDRLQTFITPIQATYGN
jgi:hypothetical protein